MLIKQRTMLINTLHGLMAEFGIAVPEGPHHLGSRIEQRNWTLNQQDLRA
jgi:hypothetical protein